MKEKFFQNKLALITLLSACGIVAVSMGLRQTFGLFSDFFVKDLLLILVVKSRIIFG